MSGRKKEFHAKALSRESEENKEKNQTLRLSSRKGLPLGVLALWRPGCGRKKKAESGRLHFDARVGTF
jgi:hypothetical protein